MRMKSSRPILKMVAEALPEYEISVPSSKQCKLVNGHVPDTYPKVCLGGLSYPTKDDHKLYFAPLFHRKAGERQEVKNLEQLVKMLREELNKRGLLILPKHL